MEITITAINCDLPFFDYLKRELELALKAKVALKTMNLPLEAYDEKRDQFDAKKLLDKVIKEPGERVIAITEKDMYFDGMSFIFGMGNLGGRHCIISMARLNPAFYNEENMDRFKERVLKEVFHELGHITGLMHCKQKECVMSFSNSIAELDSKKQEFCSGCSIKIK